jgi:hypothetical protein
MSDFVYRTNASANGLRKPRNLPVQYRMDQPRPGYVAVRPQSNEGVFTFGLISFALAAFLAFKVMLVVALNPTVYGLRVDVLANGTSIERLGARLMDIDPITQFFSQMILSVF